MSGIGSIMTTLALIGNPNSGKTTLFNGLTGSRQRIGNWPGVTVEQKTGHYHHGDLEFELVDLPGVYSLDGDASALDQQIAQDYLISGSADVIVNVVDATSLERGLYLTTQLLELGLPVVVVVNMMDATDSRGIHLDPYLLSAELGCAVVPTVASSGEGLSVLKDVIDTNLRSPATPLGQLVEAGQRYRKIDELLKNCLRTTKVTRTSTDIIDAVVLNRFLALPIFLSVMYLMFVFTINIGSAFIDFFDLAGSALFVELPRQALQTINTPDWLTTFIADGIGGGVQLVGTFIPIIACMFLFLSVLEDSGYMGRVAFIIDRLMKRLGLPGKSFVPLIVGFGCNVPAVMATRSLDNEPDRILTTIMAPYMSCGARLTVYALFAAAFFPSNGQNLVFALYLIGIVVAVFSGLLVRRFLIRGPRTELILELPAYHLPRLKSVLIHTWQRLKGFIVRAGKAIVAVVIILNVLNSWGSDGSFGNQNKASSVLSVVGKTITPIFHPMGIDKDNWQATVGIFTGVFAKEVVVGTLDALYSPGNQTANTEILTTLKSAVASVPTNLSEIANQLLDPLGIDLGNLDNDLENAANQQVELNTIMVMRDLFNGPLGAFSYLLFILLYVPCAATVGAVYKEIGAFWAIFSTSWSIIIAYSVAVTCYQLGTLPLHPASSIAWTVGAISLAGVCFALLIRLGRQHVDQNLIPVMNIP